MLNRDQLDAGHHALRQALNLPDGTEADDALDVDNLLQALAAAFWPGLDVVAPRRALSSAALEPPPGSIVATEDCGVWQRMPAHTDDPDDGRGGARRWCELGVLGGDVATWVRVAGNYGPAYLLASPPA